MDQIYQPSSDVHVLPVTMPMGPEGVLTVNAFMLTAQEPVLVDTGIGQCGDELLEAVDSVVGLANLRWLWLTHDDADHTGAVQRVMDAAPQVRLVTHAFSAMRMSTWWPVPLDRVHAIRPGDRLHVGDRTLRAVAPPLYDSPMSIGVLDESTGSLFSVDSFGAVLPAATQDAGEVPHDALAGGMLAWSAMDSPWSSMLDRAKFGEVLDGVRRLEPSRIFSSHLPAASGTSLEQFLEVLASVPDATPVPAPSHTEFTAMIEGMQSELEVASSAG
ncbi:MULTISPECIES: MBL fold metallo-hydrolase [unclassified Knoellia]|uniref:MBL fold metallo-hydrolase n=1 Tax=Knoellia altitudinis TaxID=3404795 RepID=UPI003622236A